MQRVRPRDEDKDKATRRLGVALLASLALHALGALSGPIGWAVPVPQAGTRVPERTQGLAEWEVRARLVLWNPTGVSAARGGVIFDHLPKWAADANFYRVEELDVLPVPRKPFEPAHIGAERISLLTRIDASGRVIDLSVFDADPVHADPSAAVQSLQRMSFRPGRRHGQAVRSEVVIEFAGNAAR